MAKKKQAPKPSGPSNSFIPGYVPPPPPPPRPPWGDIGQTITPPKPAPIADPVPIIPPVSDPVVNQPTYFSPAIFNNVSPTTSTPAKIVKTPERFLATFRQDTTASTLEKLLFENIGGIEIANIQRHDTIDGKNPYYGIISNLSRIKERLDPITLISRQRAGLRPGDFGKQISLSTKIPLDDYLRDNNLTDYIFIDSDDESPTYGSLIIDLVNIESDELIEVEVALSGTIYQAGE